MLAVHVHQATKTFGGFGQPVWSVKSPRTARALIPPAAALDRVTFNVAEGEIFAVVGPAGSGKSTLIRVLAGLLSLDSGEARVFGLDVCRQRSQVQRLVNRVSIEASFFKGLSPLENLLAGSVSFPQREQTPEQPVLELLARLGVDERSARLPMETLGRDVQQIVFLARAMLGRPRLLLLDEPMAGLDYFARYRVREALRQLRRAYGVAMLVTTRDRIEAEGLADRLAIMERGRIVSAETLEPEAAQPAWMDAEPAGSFAVESLDI